MVDSTLAPHMKAGGRSLETRFMVSFGIVVVLLMSVVIFMVEKRQATTMLDQTRMRGESVANSIAAVIVNSLTSYDYSGLQSAADDATEHGEVAYVVILNKEGAVAGCSGRPDQQHAELKDQVSLLAWQTEQLLIQTVEHNEAMGLSTPHLDIAVPVYIENSPMKWGTVRVGLSLDSMRHELAKTRQLLLALALAAVIMVLVAARVLTSQITRPLRRLAEATHLLARDELDTVVEENFGGELGDLARSFNRMIYDLRRSRDAVRYQNQHLENMVQERTAALRDKAREFERANAELKEVDRLKSDFLSNVSHELRTPLTSIRSFTDIMRDPDMELANEERNEFLSIVADQANRLTRLISDLLDLSRIEAGEFNIQLSTMSVYELVDACVGTLQKLASDKGIKLEIELEKGMPNVLGDIDRLSQVLTNLIDNAIKFTPAGGSIVVSASPSARRTYRKQPGTEFAGLECDLPEGGQYLVIRVADTGTGIDPRDQKRIFEKFGQVGNVLTNKPEGTGLGLAISGNIMIQHGGAIWVQSAPNKGTAFYFSVPIVSLGAPTVPEPVRDEPEIQFDPEALVRALQKVCNGGRRVLIVDDDATLVTHFASILEPPGYRVVGCNNGTEAVQKARDLRPDCILLDTVNLAAHGYDVLRFLKGQAETADIPVVVMTNQAIDDRAYELGAAGQVHKPTSFAELFETVRP